MRKLLFLFLPILFLTTSLVQGQSVLDSLHRNEKVQFSGFVQFWMRHTDLNPGSTIEGTSVSKTGDVSIRRIRLSMKGQLFEKWFYKITLGTNNISHLHPEASLNILDAEAIFAYKPWLQIGGGKTGFNGFSRYSTPATSSMVGHDWPIFAAPTINISDDLLRRMSVFAKGQIGRLDYRSALSRPLMIQREMATSSNSNYSSGFPGILRSFYLKYHFLEKESNKSAFSPGSYHGTKRIFNIGLGAQFQRDAFLTENTSGDTTYHDMLVWSTDFFLDIPLIPSNGISVNFYTAYFNYDFGPNYIRNIGANNPANGQDGGSFNGPGNSYPAIGTGEVIFIQGALRFATPRLTQGLQAIQPYASIQYADYERLTDVMVVYDGGFSFLFNGHKSKFNVGYQNRPIFEESSLGLIETDRKTMVVLQYQLKF